MANHPDSLTCFECGRVYSHGSRFIDIITFTNVYSYLICFNFSRYFLDLWRSISWWESNCVFIFEMQTLDPPEIQYRYYKTDGFHQMVPLPITYGWTLPLLKTNKGTFLSFMVRPCNYENAPTSVNLHNIELEENE